MTVTGRQAILGQLLENALVVPVAVIDDAKDAVPLANALKRGGLRTIEVTLRTPVALECIKAINEEVDGIVVAAGTIITPAQLAAVSKIGCSFAVSPGSTPGLLEAAKDEAIPLLPGASTITEVLVLREIGYRYVKFFPAEQSGGMAALAAFASVIPDVRFCPTGGISAQNVSKYLGLPNVACVGGSWMVPKALVKSSDWSGIEKLAAAARKMAEERSVDA